MARLGHTYVLVFKNRLWGALLTVAQVALATILLGTSTAASADTATPPPTTTPYPTPRCASGTRGGVRLNGSKDDVSVADSASLNPTTGLTYMVWAKLDGLAGGALGGKWVDTVQETWLLEVTYDGTFFRARAALSETPTRSGGAVFTFGLPVGDFGWHHYALVFDGAQGEQRHRAKIYVDAVEQGASVSGAIPSLLTVSAAPFEIGGNATLSRGFQGTLDEPKLYNRALTAAEIRDDFHAAVGDCSAASGLVGGWHLNESSGTRAADYSGNGNTGTLMNGATFTSAGFMCCPVTSAGTPRRVPVAVTGAVILGVVVVVLLVRRGRPQHNPDHRV